MKELLAHKVEFALVFVLGFVLMAPGTVLAQQNHVVSPSEIQNDVAAAAASRQQNLQQLKRSLSNPEAQRAMESAHIDYREVTKAVSQLNDEELAQLAARSTKTQADFAAGTMDNRDLLIILVCIAALILIIVAVH